MSVNVFLCFFSGRAYAHSSNVAYPSFSARSYEQQNDLARFLSLKKKSEDDDQFLKNPVK